MWARIRCLFQGHQYRKVREVMSPDLQDSFVQSNTGTGPIRHTGYNVKRCKRCKHEKWESNGKSELR